MTTQAETTRSVKIHRWIFSLLSATMISGLVACNSGSTFNVQNPPPPPASDLSIAFQSQPATTIAVGLSLSVVAVVSNDPNNNGVDWALSCPSGVAPGNCGTLSLTHTASGTANIYTAPASVNLNNLSGVNLIAYATANHVVNTFASFTVTSFDSGFKAGNYVLQAQGSGGQFAGVLTLDGAGNITAGEQTIDFFGESVTDQGLTGNYFVGNDGRGTITINDPDPGIGSEIFALVFLNNAADQALISVISGPIISATGTMDPQTSTAAPYGSFAFVASGTALYYINSAALPVAFGGVLNIASPTSISGVADELFGKKINAEDVAITGTFTTVPNDPFGTVIFNWTAPFGPPSSPQTNLQFTAYIVDATHLQLIETDQSVGAGFGATAGIAIGQGSAAGNFGNASLPGGTSYVFGVTGQDLSTNATNNGSLPDTLTAAGLLQADGSGNLTAGFTDISLLYNTAQGTNVTPQTGAQISAHIVSGTYAVDANGRALFNNFVFDPSPRHGYDPTLFLYLTGLSGTSDPAALVLAAGDTTIGSIYYPSIGTGVAYQQSTAAATFLGDYGMSFTQQNGTENDGTAAMTVNAASTPAVSGFADTSSGGQGNSFLGTFSGPTSAVPFSGTLYANPNFAGNANVFPLVGSGPSPMTVDYYFIDPDHGFWAETDLVSAASGQVSFGYYAGRAPLCSQCP